MPNGTAVLPPSANWSSGFIEKFSSSSSLSFFFASFFFVDTVDKFLSPYFVIANPEGVKQSLKPAYTSHGVL
jgi:hypothetical protein